MAYPGTPTNAEFGAGVNHMTNPGRANVGGITLATADQGLDQTSARWNGLVPQGVHPSALSAGTPADTDMSTELGQEAVGNTNDPSMANHDMLRAMMRQAFRGGSNDNIA